MIQGVSGVLSAVKAMDIITLINGLQNLHEGVAGIGSAAVGTLSGTMKLYKRGQDLLKTLKECLDIDN